MDEYAGYQGWLLEERVTRKIGEALQNLTLDAKVGTNPDTQQGEVTIHLRSPGGLITSATFALPKPE